MVWKFEIRIKIIKANSFTKNILKLQVSISNFVSATLTLASQPPSGLKFEIRNKNKHLFASTSTQRIFCEENNNGRSGWKTVETIHLGTFLACTGFRCYDNGLCSRISSYFPGPATGMLHNTLIPLTGWAPGLISRNWTKTNRYFSPFHNLANTSLANSKNLNRIAALYSGQTE